MCSSHVDVYVCCCRLASDTLNDEEKQRRERMRQASRGIASFRVAPNSSTILIPLSSNLYLVDRHTRIIRTLTTTCTSYPNYPSFSRCGAWVSCVRDGDVWIHSTVKEGVEYRLTHTASATITNGTGEACAWATCVWIVYVACACACYRCAAHVNASFSCHMMLLHS